MIDPDRESRQSLGLLCQRFGVEFLEARGLIEGVRLFKERTIDLIVMDMFLPQKSGLALIAEITSHDNHPPIIATFSAGQAPTINFKKFTHILGASYTFEKPVNVRLFQHAFLELIPHAKERDDHPPL
jgi:DNA-binding response OmpR family regulator